MQGGGGVEGQQYLNSKEMVVNSIENGRKYIELDFLYTSDKQIVASHEFENLENFSLTIRPTLQEFESQKLYGKYTGVTYEWLLDLLKTYPDITIIFDTKENDSLQILSDMAKIAESKQVNLYSQMIVQVYSFENYLQIKQNLNFERFWYTNYKSKYPFYKIINYFGDKSDVETVVMNKLCFFAYIQSSYKLNKKIAVHTINGATMAQYLIRRGVDYIFTDFL